MRHLFFICFFPIYLLAQTQGDTSLYIQTYQDLKANLYSHDDSVDVLYIPFSGEKSPENQAVIIAILDFYLELKETYILQIEIHTDCRGSEAYSDFTSNRLAKQMEAFFILNEIPQNQLSINAYGNSRPRINCKCKDCTEEEHFKNRRVTIRLLEML